MGKRKTELELKQGYACDAIMEMVNVLEFHGMRVEGAHAHVAAVRALSGREMSGRDVWERMHRACGARYRGMCETCDASCDMAHCPRLR